MSSPASTCLCSAAQHLQAGIRQENDFDALGLCCCSPQALDERTQVVALGLVAHTLDLELSWDRVHCVFSHRKQFLTLLELNRPYIDLMMRSGGQQRARQSVQGQGMGFA